MADATNEQLAKLVFPLYKEADGGIVCDFGGRIDYPDGFAYLDGPRFTWTPGMEQYGMTYQDVANELDVRTAERLAQR